VLETREEYCNSKNQIQGFLVLNKNFGKLYTLSIVPSPLNLCKNNHTSQIQKVPLNVLVPINILHFYIYVNISRV
jgi:hypothetical protein